MRGCPRFSTFEAVGQQRLDCGRPGDRPLQLLERGPFFFEEIHALLSPRNNGAGRTWGHGSTLQTLCCGEARAALEAMRRTAVRRHGWQTRQLFFGDHTSVSLGRARIVVIPTSLPSSTPLLAGYVCRSVGSHQFPMHQMLSHVNRRIQMNTRPLTLLATCCPKPSGFPLVHSRTMASERCRGLQRVLLGRPRLTGSTQQSMRQSKQRPSLRQDSRLPRALQLRLERPIAQ